MRKKFLAQRRKGAKKSLKNGFATFAPLRVRFFSVKLLSDKAGSKLLNRLSTRGQKDELNNGAN